MPKLRTGLRVEVWLWPFVPAGMRRLSEFHLFHEWVSALPLLRFPSLSLILGQLGKSCKFLDLQVCRHSVMVAASIRYPLHNLQVMCWLRFTNGNLTRFWKKKNNDFHKKNMSQQQLSALIQHLTIRWALYGFDRCCCFTYNLNFKVWASTHTLGDILSFQGLISRKMVFFYQHFAEPTRLWGRTLESFLTFVWAPQLSLQ